MTSSMGLELFGACCAADVVADSFALDPGHGPCCTVGDPGVAEGAVAWDGVGGPRFRRRHLRGHPSGPAQLDSVGMMTDTPPSGVA
jgi:hypothetical protein